MMAFSFLLLKATDYKITLLLLSLHCILVASEETQIAGLWINFSTQNMHSVSLNKSSPSVTLRSTVKILSWFTSILWVTQWHLVSTPWKVWASQCQLASFLEGLADSWTPAWLTLRVVTLTLATPHLLYVVWLCGRKIQWAAVYCG